MTLKERIQEDMKAAMRAKDAPRLSAVRLLLAAMKQREVDERVVLDDAAALAIVEKMIKQRRESIAQFESAGRQDLSAGEKFEQVNTIYPNVHDGVEGMYFIQQSVESSKQGGAWLPLKHKRARK